MQIENFLLKIKETWDTLVAEGKQPFNAKLLEKKTLDPKDGRLPFILVLNEGRLRYFKKNSLFSSDDICQVCNEETVDLGINEFKSLRTILYIYPCVPYQFILASKAHTTEIMQDFIVDMINFTKKTGMKLYYHKPKDSRKLTTHFHIKTGLPSDTAFLMWVKTDPLIEKSGVLIERLVHTVFGLRLSGNSGKIAEIIFTLFRGDQFPLSLVFWSNYVYIFPRADEVIPPNFGDWKFGALEIIGVFICRDRETFQNLNYEYLEKAMAAVTLDKENQVKIEKNLINFLEND